MCIFPLPSPTHSTHTQGYIWLLFIMEWVGNWAWVGYVSTHKTYCILSYHAMYIVAIVGGIVTKWCVIITTL